MSRTWRTKRSAGSRPAAGVEERAINSIVLWSLIGAIVGARFFYVLAHWSEFSPKPIESVYIWKGGISLLGGIAGATIANAINIRRFGLRFFQVADALAAPLALGIAVGRIGDLIIGDHLGKPTSWLLAWTLQRRDARAAVELPGGRPVVHRRPAERHVQGDPHEHRRDAAAVTVVNGVQQKLGAVVERASVSTRPRCTTWCLHGSCSRSCGGSSSNRAVRGSRRCCSPMYYGCCRLLEDFLRIDKRFGPLTGSQWTALGVVILRRDTGRYFAITKRPGPTTPPRPRIRRTRDAAEPQPTPTG